MNKIYKTKKQQKAIIIASAVLVVIGICCYVYARDKLFSGNEIQYDESEIMEEESDKTGKSSDTEEKTNTIKVHISGAVKNQGIVELEEGSRIADAIEKAGGTTENVCIEEINLAYVLEDGMKIKIPTKEEVQELKQNSEGNNGEDIVQIQIQGGQGEQGVQRSQSSKGNQSSQGSQASQGNQGNQGSQENQGSVTITKGASTVQAEQNNTKSKIININTATQEELQTLPGVGEATATKIINYRKENGKFKTKEDIKNVSGIGNAKYEKIKDLITT